VQSKNYTVRSVDHKFFFEPGHSYNVCDQDFGLIENRKRRADNVKTPDGWQDLVDKSSKKFSVVRMDQTDMKSLSFIVQNGDILVPAYSRCPQYLN